MLSYWLTKLVVLVAGKNPSSWVILAQTTGQGNLKGCNSPLHNYGKV